ncbi:MAG: dockerin type I repeat-containing protein [Planctomycetota bacterium]
MKSITPGALAVFFSLVGSVATCRGQTSEHVVEIVGAAAQTGQLVEVSVLHSNFSTEDTTGWSLSVTHDPSQMTLVVVEPGPDTFAIWAGSPPYFSSFQLTAAGWSHGVVLSSFLPDLPPGADYQLEIAEYEVLMAPGESAAICFCDCIGAIPVATVFVTGCGTVHVPEQFCGSVSVPLGEFRRADCNIDGGVDITDPIRILDYLFTAGLPPPCRDACDVNDDGELNIADAIYALAALILPGSPPVPAPGAFSCGVDPTSDGLDCATYMTCP